MLKASKIPLLNSSSRVQLNHSVKAHSQEKRSTFMQNSFFCLFCFISTVNKLSHICNSVYGSTVLGRASFSLVEVHKPSNSLRGTAVLVRKNASPEPSGSPTSLAQTIECTSHLLLWRVEMKSHFPPLSSSPSQKRAWISKML